MMVILAEIWEITGTPIEVILKNKNKKFLKKCNKFSQNQYIVLDYLRIYKTFINKVCNRR